MFKTSSSGRVKYCHLFADTLEELHSFASVAGIKRCWYEKSRTGIPHYDLNPENRARAISAGAVETSRKLNRNLKT